MKKPQHRIYPVEMLQFTDNQTLVKNGTLCCRRSWCNALIIKYIRKFLDSRGNQEKYL